MKVASVFIALLLVLVTGSCNKEDTTSKELRFYTEVLEPYNYLQNGTPVGITTDLVKRILQDFGLTNPIQYSTNWDSLLTLLKTQNNTVLFSTSLTTERKELFKWAGPVALWHTAFIGLANSAISITTPDDARELTSVGVVTGYSTVDILTSLGFTNLTYFSTLEEMVQALYSGTVPVIFEDPGMITAVASGQALDPAKLNKLFVYSTEAGYLAFSPDVPDRTVTRWQDKIDELKDSGFLQGLFEEYLPGIQAPGRIVMFTEENPPQSYRDISGTLTGSSVEMVEAMLETMGMTESPEYTSWTNAYDQIRLIPNSMAFSTLRSDEREPLFHWVGPLCKKRYCFYARSSDESDISTIEAARHMQSVGTVAGWASEEELTQLGFRNVVAFPTPQEVFQKLMDGDIQCAVLNDISMRYLGLAAGHPPKDYRKGAVLSEGETYIAFSIDTDDQYIKDWTDAYNTLVSSGRLAGIWSQWYPDIDW